MPNAKHTKEPWRANDCRCILVGTQPATWLADFRPDPDHETGLANTKRAVACVNACRPRGPVARLAELLETVRLRSVEHENNGIAVVPDKLYAEIRIALADYKAAFKQE